MLDHRKIGVFLLLSGWLSLTYAAGPVPPATGQPPRASPQTTPPAQSPAANAQPAAAPGGGGYYEYIPWRANDPFVFCKYGPPRSHCWRPVHPPSATWVPTCRPVNTRSLSYYIRVCPQAEGMGEWVPDNDGTPTTTPFVH
jgi:hypothetical protein